MSLGLLNSLFVDYLHYKRYLNESVSTLKSIRSTEADPYNTKLYFNPNCILQLILDYICTEAHINIDGELQRCRGTKSTVFLPNVDNNFCR